MHFLDWDLNTTGGDKGLGAKVDCEACEDVWLCVMTVYGVKRCRLERLGTAPDTEVGGVYREKGGGVGGCRLCGDTAGGSCAVRKRVFKATGVGEGQ